MARYGTIKRNLRRNIKPWSEDEAAKSRDSLETAARAVAVFLALALAGAFVPLAVNLIFRIPDLYSFDLSRTDALADMGVKAKEDKVADAISSFMRRKTDSLQVEAESGEKKVPLFTANDGAVMLTLRSFLDNICVIGFTALALFIVLSAMLVRWNRPRELRRGFTGGFVIYGALVCFTAIAMTLGGPVARIWPDTIGARFAPSDTLPALFHLGFFLMAWIAVTVITLVIMLVLLSVVSKLTKHERMFLRKK
jgi:hypothetical protein